MRRLLAAVRPDAVALVDSFGISDHRLKSALGRRDGKVYEALLESARRSTLNAQEPVEGYREFIRPLVQPPGAPPIVIPSRL